MKAVRFLMLLVMSGLLAACITITGSGKVITETRNLGGFTRVSLRCSADVVITQGSPQSVAVEAEDNIVPLIITDVSGGTLTIDIRANTSFSTTRPKVVHVTVPNLNSLQTTASGDITIDQWSTGKAQIESTGSGDIHIVNIQADAITVRTTGSGDITVDGGKTTTQQVNTYGSGTYNGAGVQSSSTDAKATGSGDITVWAVDNLTASTSGSGDIGYYGSPQVSEHSSGSGDVERRGDKP